MTTVRIAHIEPWPGRRMGGRGFRISSFLVVLADASGGRALPIWLNGPDGHGLFRGRAGDRADRVHLGGHRRARADNDPHRVRAGHGLGHRCADPGCRPADGPARAARPRRSGGSVHQGRATATAPPPPAAPVPQAHPGPPGRPLTPAPLPTRRARPRPQQGQALRVEELRKVPAAIRFSSAEPMLGPLDLDVVRYRFFLQAVGRGRQPFLHDLGPSA